MIYHIVRFFPEYCTKRLKLNYDDTGCSNPEFLIMLRQRLDNMLTNSNRENVIKKVIKHFLTIAHHDRYAKILGSKNATDDSEEEIDSD